MRPRTAGIAPKDAKSAAHIRDEYEAGKLAKGLRKLT